LSGRSRARLFLRRAGMAAGRLGGFSLSTMMLAVASIVAMPVMVAADGPYAWGSIALGQAIGAISALIVGYGWAVSGPTAVARGNDSQRRAEYFESLRVKLILLIPMGACAAVVAIVIARHGNSFAAAGALSATATALTGNWYFAGLSRPYVWLCLESLPRVSGIALGIVLMSLGHGAITGLACNTAGMVAAFTFVTLWVRRRTAAAPRSGPSRPLTEVLVSRRHGLASIVGSQLFLSAPLAVISVLAPGTQPVFALIDKVRQLISAGLNPMVAFLQGWVPRGSSDMHVGRGRTALIATSIFAAVFGGAFYLVGPDLVHWLGNGQIAVPGNLIALTAAMISLGLIDSVLAYAVLASQGRLRLTARATTISIVVMLPAVTAGAYYFGAAGALSGALVGLMTRLGIELRGTQFRADAPGCNAGSQHETHVS
jgi:hypothetical protein